MVDTQNIQKLLKLNFVFEPESYVSIDNQGYVSSLGTIHARSREMTLLDGTIVDYLPVKFDIVQGNFMVGRTGLATLEGCPRLVGGKFSCAGNPIKSLQGGPASVGEHYYCSDTGLTTLTGAPTQIALNFFCNNNTQLKTLDGAPAVVLGEFSCIDSAIEDLNGLPHSMGTVYLTYTETLPLLRTLSAKQIALDVPAQVADHRRVDEVVRIINRYAGEGKRGVIRCQKELIKAGFEGNARW